MRLLRCSSSGEFGLTKDLVEDDTIPPYAILSHTWGPDTEEVTFEDMTNGTGKNKPGYENIRFCGEQARQNGLEYFWIDTCCTIQSHHRRQMPYERSGICRRKRRELSSSFKYQTWTYSYFLTQSLFCLGILVLSCYTLMAKPDHATRLKSVAELDRASITAAWVKVIGS